MVVELHSKTYGWLTYARSPNEPEDISFFERARTKNIASYASTARLAERGKFYSEDDDETYDVENYTLDVTFDPSRAWISGKTSIKLKTKVFATSSLTFRLAQSLAVSSVSSPTFGYLLSLRVVGQNSVLVSLPKLVPGGTEIVLDVAYSGRLEPQSLDREAISVEPQIQEPQAPPQGDSPILQPEPRFMYSNRIYWYPQAQVTDYATATMRLTVPSEYQIVASGVPEPATLGPCRGRSTRSNPKFMRTVEYRADRPVRYLACVISRFVPIGSTKVEVPALALGRWHLGFTDRQQRKHRSRLDAAHGRPQQVADARASPTSCASTRRLIGEAPYPNFTLAALDDNLPGGHSPAFFAIFQQPLPTTPYSWSERSGRVRRHYPNFFLAHEVAHQWWGQAVGWKNYHEQWLSEGLAQYFAVLYAGADRGPDTLEALIAQMRDSAMPASVAGPDLARLPARPHSERRARLPRHRLQQVRRRAAHAAAAHRRRGVLCRAPDGSTRTGGSRRPAPTTCARRSRAARRCRSAGSSIAGSLESCLPEAARDLASPKAATRRRPDRAGRRRLRPAPDGDGRVRGRADRRGRRSR